MLPHRRYPRHGGSNFPQSLQARSTNYKCCKRCVISKPCLAAWDICSTVWPCLVLCGSKLKPCHTCCVSNSFFTCFVLQEVFEACLEFQLYLVHSVMAEHTLHMGAFMSHKAQPILCMLGGVPLVIPCICSCLVPCHTMYVGMQGACWIMML